ncbi:inositol phospholipid synthesis and fat-storage-inducing TM-domain-containing protein [Epithele typhae]|uniref:inositol phospholipid synthesis and fat-storage-inducing TM-domain-containing protein n=1 Tax=Epithele typhae TaxID=378194 RepID=UPI0020084930|nr:inositol phospholipid synthesis and fat-storage-inducing TM-domain-containing protein [Epithele typhae]KAH9942258.1 inositol phospholipid synthesis and fat-storage-inducing TM-domain-containing protein [Epithele typhae]
MPLLPRSLQAIVVVTAAIVFLGTLFSVLTDSYLDTSNPLLTTLPHHLSATHRFASKKNILNVYFTKRLWAWSTATFLALFTTSSAPARRAARAAQYVLATALFLAFTSWFFGPSFLDRLILSTGGECTLHLPSGDAVAVPQEYCVSRTTLSPGTHPAIFAGHLHLPSDGWTGVARLRKGHDVSGHIFLLTLSSLLIVDQLRWSFGHARSAAHTLAVVFASAVLGASLFAMYTTSVYFHTPLEKFTGYVLGLVCFMITRLPLSLNAVSASIPVATPQ